MDQSFIRLAQSYDVPIPTDRTLFREFETNQGGFRWRFAIQAVGARGPHVLTVQILDSHVKWDDIQPFAHPYAFQGQLVRITSRGWLDRLGQGIKFDPRFKVGDSRFDRRILVDSSLPLEQTQQLLLQSSVRGAIIETIRLRCKEISVFNRGVQIVFPYSPHSSMRLRGHLEHLKKVLEPLAELVKTLPKIPDTKARFGFGTASLEESLENGLVLAGVVALVGFYFYQAVDRYFGLLGKMPMRAIFLGAIFLGVLPTMWVAHRWAGKARRLKKALAAFVFTALMMIPWVSGGLLLINGIFDGSPGSIQEGIVEKLVYGKRSQSEIWIRFGHGSLEMLEWDHRVEALKLELKVGMELEVEVHAGAFGFPWVKSVHIKQETH